jgi:hypothetical protein
VTEFERYIVEEHIEDAAWIATIGWFRQYVRSPYSR